MASFFILLGVVLWVVLAFWPAVVAKRKGYSFWLFLIVAWLVSWLLALIIALFLHDKTESTESRAADKAADKALAKEENQS